MDDFGASWYDSSGGCEIVRVLIIGGSGFVGKCLQKAILRAADWDEIQSVRVASRDPVVVDNRIQASRWNVLGEEDLEGDYDVIVHAATPSSSLAPSGLGEIYEQIVRGMKGVLRVCARQRRVPRLIFTSSGAVYGEMSAGQERWIESVPVRTFPDGHPNDYAKGKVEAEDLLRLAGERGICRPSVARLFSFSGADLPLTSNFALSNFVRDAFAGGPIMVQGSGASVRSYLDGHDLGNWLLAMIKLDLPQVECFHIGSEREITIKELAELVRRCCHSVLGQVPDVVVAGGADSGSGSQRYVPSTEMTRSVLGVEESVRLDASVFEMLKAHRIGEARL